MALTPRELADAEVVKAYGRAALSCHAPTTQRSGLDLHPWQLRSRAQALHHLSADLPAWSWTGVRGADLKALSRQPGPSPPYATILSKPDGPITGQLANCSEHKVTEMLRRTTESSNPEWQHSARATFTQLREEAKRIGVPRRTIDGALTRADLECLIEDAKTGDAVCRSATRSQLSPRSQAAREFVESLDADAARDFLRWQL